METKKARLVNVGYAGEPENICLQIEDTRQTFSFSQILNENINDNDITHPIIQQILNGDHTVDIIVDENNNITLHF